MNTCAWRTKRCFRRRGRSWPKLGPRNSADESRNAKKRFDLPRRPNSEACIARTQSEEELRRHFTDHDARNRPHRCGVSRRSCAASSTTECRWFLGPQVWPAGVLARKWDGECEPDFLFLTGQRLGLDGKARHDARE